MTIPTPATKCSSAPTASTRPGPSSAPTTSAGAASTSSGRCCDRSISRARTRKAIGRHRPQEIDPTSAEHFLGVKKGEQAACSAPRRRGRAGARHPAEHPSARPRVDQPNSVVRAMIASTQRQEGAIGIRGGRSISVPAGEYWPGTGSPGHRFVGDQEDCCPELPPVAQFGGQFDQGWIGGAAHRKYGEVALARRRSPDRPASPGGRSSRLAPAQQRKYGSLDRAATKNR